MVLSGTNSEISAGKNFFLDLEGGEKLIQMTKPSTRETYQNILLFAKGSKGCLPSLLLLLKNK